jgi:hypothetical protein
MTEKKKDGLWNLTKELAKEVQGYTKELAKDAPGYTKELAKEVLSITKELTKEAPSYARETQKIIGNAIEGVKSTSEEIKVDAHKSTLEHIEKIKKLEKRAKDAGISEEGLAKLKKDFGFTQKKSEDTQRESEVSTSTLDSIRILACRGLDLEYEKRFEQHIKSIEEEQEMARNWKPKKK